MGHLYQSIGRNCDLQNLVRVNLKDDLKPRDRSAGVSDVIGNCVEKSLNNKGTLDGILHFLTYKTLKYIYDQI